MTTRTWLRNPGRLVKSGLLALAGGLLLAPSAGAEPITYSTSGTVAIANEPDHQLYGLTGVSPDGTLPPGNADGNRYPPGLIKLGYVNIIPPDGEGPLPHVSNTPFDVKLAFNNGLPTLELKGTLDGSGSSNENGSTSFFYVGKVASVTSSDPALNVNLPAPFADIVAHPERLTLRMGTWDWGVDKLFLSAAYSPVPEPSSAAVFLGALGGLGWYARRRTGPRRG